MVLLTINGRPVEEGGCVELFLPKLVVDKIWW